MGEQRNWWKNRETDGRTVWWTDKQTDTDKTEDVKLEFGARQNRTVPGRGRERTRLTERGGQWDKEEEIKRVIRRQTDGQRPDKALPSGWREVCSTAAEYTRWIKAQLPISQRGTLGHCRRRRRRRSHPHSHTLTRHYVGLRTSECTGGVHLPANTWLVVGNLYADLPKARLIALLRSRW